MHTHIWTIYHRHTAWRQWTWSAHTHNPENIIDIRQGQPRVRVVGPITPCRAGQTSGQLASTRFNSHQLAQWTAANRSDKYENSVTSPNTVKPFAISTAFYNGFAPQRYNMIQHVPKRSEVLQLVQTCFEVLKCLRLVGNVERTMTTKSQDTSNMLSTCFKHAKDMQRTCKDHAKNTQKACNKHATRWAQHHLERTYR